VFQSGNYYDNGANDGCRHSIVDDANYGANYEPDYYSGPDGFYHLNPLKNNPACRNDGATIRGHIKNPDDCFPGNPRLST
jgi:hypothetical protein